MGEVGKATKQVVFLDNVPWLRRGILSPLSFYYFLRVYSQ